MTRLGAILLLIAGAAHAEGLTLAISGVTLQNLDAKAGDFYLLQLSQELSAAGAKVVTPKEMAALIGIERQRQLLASCDDAASSCLAELANALGADGAVMLAVGRFGERFQVTLKVLGTRDAKTLAQFSRRVDGEEAVLDALADAAREVVEAAPRALGRPIAPAAVAEDAVAAPTRVWVPMVVGGGVLLLGGIACALAAMSEHDALLNDDVPLTAHEGMIRAQRGNGFQWAATLGIAVGGALLAAGVITYFIVRRPTAAVALTPTANGFALGGTW